jgi:hypothetical protein
LERFPSCLFSRTARLWILTRIGFAGHSYGAGATPEWLGGQSRKGWGDKRFVMFSNGCLV